MTKFIVLFFACVIASTALENPTTPMAAIFKNGVKPTDASVKAAYKESIVIIRKMFDKQILQLHDIHKTTLHENEHLVDIDLTNGQLTGLETVYGIEAPRARVKHNYGILNVPYKFTNYRVTYDYSVMHKNMGRQDKLIAEFSGFRCDIVVHINRSTLKASSYDIKCKNNGPINIQVEGVTNEAMLSFIVPIFKELIEDAITEKSEQIIVDVINHYNSNI